MPLEIRELVIKTRLEDNRAESPSFGKLDIAGLKELGEKLLPVLESKMDKLIEEKLDRLEQKLGKRQER